MKLKQIHSSRFPFSKFETKTKLILIILLLSVLTGSSVLNISSIVDPILYKVIDTDQTIFTNDTAIIPQPSAGQPFYGQDAQTTHYEPSYTDNGDGTITDLNTGLMWIKARGNKVTWNLAFVLANINGTGGYNDWRVPTVKELYSLIKFNGYFGVGPSTSTPFIDTDYFDYVYDYEDTTRFFDCQDWTATPYAGLTMNGDTTIFGVNFADGRIKGYPKYQPPQSLGVKTEMYVRFVRGNPNYGVNNFIDNGDGTISDTKTGLMWQKADDGTLRKWKDALGYADTLTLALHNDWRLPNAKELQSIVDYTRAPLAMNTTKRGPSVDTNFFKLTKRSDGEYNYYWTGTTMIEGPPLSKYVSAVYISFGRALGWIDSVKYDVHGAGAQRADYKKGDTTLYPYGHGPQGDVIRINNGVLCVRNAANVFVTDALVGNGVYPTLDAAFTAINSGAQTGANIEIDIAGDTQEPSTGAILNAGAWSSLNMQPRTPSVTVSGNITGSALVRLYNADNVTIDGQNKLTFINTSTSSQQGTSTIRLEGGATYNIIENCIIKGSSGSSFGNNCGNILFGGNGNSNGTGNSFNTIKNCDIGAANINNPPAIGICSLGDFAVAQRNIGDSIKNCTIHDYFFQGGSSMGLFADDGTEYLTIKDNKFYQSIPKVQSTNGYHSAITLDGFAAYSGFQIEGNIIGYADSLRNGIYTISGGSNQFHPIHVAVGTSAVTNIVNNEIAAIDQTTSQVSNPFTGIYVVYGWTNVSGNTFGSGGLDYNDYIKCTSLNGGTAQWMGIHCENPAGTPWTCSNNLIGNIQCSGMSHVFCIRAFGVGSLTCNNNTIGGNVPHSVTSTPVNGFTAVNGILAINSAGTISGNIISDLKASDGSAENNDASVSGIASVGNSDLIISQNIIHSLKNTHPTASTKVNGIYYQGPASGSNAISQNFIHTLLVSNSNSEVNGIKVFDGKISVVNNMIQLGLDTGALWITYGGIHGIWERCDNGNRTIAFNSVYIGGEATNGSSNTFAFKNTSANNNRDFRNNIFQNARTNNGGTGKHYAITIAGNTPNPQGLDIGYNIYNAGGNGGYVGLYNNTNRLHLSDWENALSQDTTSFESDPKFQNPNGSLSTVDLHINPNAGTDAEGNGFLMPFLFDFDGELRSNLSPVDIGADAGNFMRPPNITIVMFLEARYDAGQNAQVPDTVTIEARSPNPPYNVHHSVKTIVSSDGMANVAIDDGSWYIVIKHRNSIETWTANPVIVTSDNEFDFSSSPSQAYGNNQIQVDDSPVRFGIRSGDLDQDGFVDLSDVASVYNAAGNFVTGYSVYDLNGDDFVDLSDIAVIFNNSSSFVGVIRP